MFDLFNEMSETKENQEKGSEVDVEKLADIVAEKVIKKLSVTEPPKKEESNEETKEESKEESKPETEMKESEE